MSFSRELDFDPVSGVRRVFHWNSEDDSFTIETIQDVEDVVEDNIAHANADDTGWRGEAHKIASIPLNIYYQLKREGTVDDPKRFRKWLNDNANRGFRTKHGRV